MILPCAPVLTVPFKLPVTLPLMFPTKDPAVSAPVDELNVRLLPLLGGRSPVAAVTNTGKQVVSELSSATVCGPTSSD